MEITDDLIIPNPNFGKGDRYMRTLRERFQAKIRFDPVTGCWAWTGAKVHGYGTLSVFDRTELAHRITWLFFMGEIPEGLELDHLCRNPACCNPWHLEPVTHLENVRRGRAADSCRERHAAITHCPKGHPYDEENTYVAASGGRQCRICSQARDRDSRANPAWVARRNARQRELYALRKASSEL